jgi:hypothetical protein
MLIQSNKQHNKTEKQTSHQEGKSNEHRMKMKN